MKKYRFYCKLKSIKVNQHWMTFKIEEYTIILSEIELNQEET